jgi:hypothetical protein
MKIIVLGDTHGRQFWKYIVNTQKFDKLVLLGDYFDSWDISVEDQVKNFLDILEYKKNHPDKMVLLLGNHDIHYFPFIGDTGTSGYQNRTRTLISHILDENKHLFTMAYKEGQYLFTHAGVTPTWLDIHLGENTWEIKTIEQHVNDIWKHKPLSFCFKNYDGRAESSGDNPWQSPVWVRPRSLMRDAAAFKRDIIQVVGHTGMKVIDQKGKATGGRYYFIDTLGTSREYLVIEDGTLKTERL